MQDTIGLLSFEAGTGVVAIRQWRGNVHFSFLGASCPTNAKCGYESLTMLAVEPRKGGREVVALSVTATAEDRKRADLHSCFLLPATFGDDHDGKAWIDGEAPFVPSPGRLGGILGHGSEAMLSVRIGERNYVYPPLALAANTLDSITKKGYVVVNDGNVLCRFMTGEATVEDVEKAVVARPDEQSVFEQLAEAKMALDAERKRTQALVASTKTQIEILEKRAELNRCDIERHNRFWSGVHSIVAEADGAKGWFAHTANAKVKRIREQLRIFANL